MDNNTSVDDLFPSKWLRAADLGNTPRVATISGIDFAIIGRDNEKKAVVSFSNSTKKLILNATNARTLSNLFGKQLAGWIGQKITLYTCEVNYRGEMTRAVRIKEEIPGETKAEPVASAAPGPQSTPPAYPDDGKF
jgi:hypothetical protein